MGSKREEENNIILECIRQDIHNLDRGLFVLIMGDFNGHLVEFETRDDHNGTMMRHLADDFELTILNSREDCEGQYTWTVRGLQSCIDNALASKGLGSRLQKMIVDEEGEWSVGSGHNSIFQHFGAIKKTWYLLHRKSTIHLREEDIDAVAKTFDESARRVDA